MNEVNPYEASKGEGEGDDHRYEDWWEGAYAMVGALICVALLLACGGLLSALLVWL